MSRMTLLAIAAAFPGSAAAQTTTAEQALENYREALKPTDELVCPRSGDPDEITVCGRRAGPSPYRLPLPVEPEPGRRIPGEAVATVTAAGAREKCSTVGPNQNCGGGLPVFAIVGFVAKVAAKAAQEVLDPDE